MIRGLLLKIWHEVWVMTLILGLALLGVDALLTYVVPKFQDGMDEMFEQLPFSKQIMSAILGSEFGEEINAKAMQALLWVHPTILTLLWTHAIVFCTRFPAGEIDRGTIDVLLGLPVSRRKAYYTEVLAWLIAGLFVLSMGYAGHRLAAPWMPAEMRPQPWEAAYVLVNQYCVYLAVGAFTFFVSANSDRRGRAVGVTIGLVLVSFLLNFLAQFWEPADAVAWLSVMEYYRPAITIQTGEFAWADVITLLSVSTVAIALGGEIVAHRSICTT